MGLDMAGPPPGDFGMPEPGLGAPSGPPMPPMGTPDLPLPPEGIIGGKPMEDPVGIMAPMVEEEPMSEIDRAEKMLKEMAELSGGDIKITRKKKKGGKK